MSSEYIKQLEAANEELQRKLEEQGEIMDSLSEAFAQTRNEMKRSRLVILSNDPNFMVAYRNRSGETEMVHASHLAVVPVSEEERQKVFKSYQISPNVKLSLFKSIKDLKNKAGSIYDINMLHAYSKGESVKPYVI